MDSKKFLFAAVFTLSLGFSTLYSGESSSSQEVLEWKEQKPIVFDKTWQPIKAGVIAGGIAGILASACVYNVSKPASVCKIVGSSALVGFGVYSLDKFLIKGGEDLFNKCSKHHNNLVKRVNGVDESNGVCTHQDGPSNGDSLEDPHDRNLPASPLVGIR